VLDTLDELTASVQSLEGLFIQAEDLFSQKTISGLISQVIDILTKKFVPTDLTFCFYDRSMGFQTSSFESLEACEPKFQLESFELIEGFFSTYPSTIYFELFAYSFEHKHLLEELQKANPQILVPIVGIGGLYGLILIGPKEKDTQYNDLEISYLNRLMKFTAIAFQNIINYSHAVTDVKTGLFNHSFFMKRLAEEWAHAQRLKTDLGILVIDIDNFKRLNDSLGHVAGDQVIIKIAEILQEEIRTGDLVSRFGGEEFTILFRQIDRVKTWQIAERIRKKIENTKISYQKHTIQVTVSIGASTYRYSLPKVMDDMIINADEALYEAKRLGKNRTYMFGESLLFRALQRNCV